MTVVILGGGIGGLSTAYYLLRNTKRKVILLEGSSRLGGWIRSEKQPNGLIFEHGPRTLRPVGEAGANTLNLLEELDLTDSVKPILLSDPASKNRFVYVNGKLHALPSSFSSLFKKIPPFSKPLISAVGRDWRAVRKCVHDESIYDFVERRFGKELADYGISPLICGVCGGDAKNISAQFLLKDFYDKEKKYGSVIKGVLREFFEKKQVYEIGALAKAARKGFWSSYAFREGMEILPKTLAAKIEQKDATILKSTPIMGLNLRKKVVRTEKDEIPFDSVVSTLPAYSLSKLLYDDHYPVAKELAQIPYASVITVNLAYSKNLLNVHGFGFLTPPSEKLPILGKTIFHVTLTFSFSET